MFESAVFYAFAAVLLVSATLVITSRNPVHSALCTGLRDVITSVADTSSTAAKA